MVFLKGSFHFSFPAYRTWKQSEGKTGLPPGAGGKGTWSSHFHPGEPQLGRVAVLQVLLFLGPGSGQLQLEGRQASGICSLLGPCPCCRAFLTGRRVVLLIFLLPFRRATRFPTADGCEIHFAPFRNPGCLIRFPNVNTTNLLVSATVPWFLIVPQIRRQSCWFQPWHPDSPANINSKWKYPQTPWCSNPAPKKPWCLIRCPGKDPRFPPWFFIS